jgi:hypothetical protein
VVEDLTRTAAVQTSTSPFSQLGIDLSSIGDLNALVNDPSVSIAIDTLKTAVGAIPGLSSATNGQIAKIFGAVSSAQSAIGSAASVANGNVNGLSGFGGVIAGALPGAAANGLNGATSAFVQLSNLQTMQSLVGRVGMNTGLGAQ